MLRIIIALIYDTFVIIFAIFFEWKKERKNGFKDEGVGMESYLGEKNEFKIESSFPFVIKELNMLY